MFFKKKQRTEMVIEKDYVHVITNVPELVEKYKKLSENYSLKHQQINDTLETFVPTVWVDIVPPSIDC